MVQVVNCQFSKNIQVHDTNIIYIYVIISLQYIYTYGHIRIYYSISIVYLLAQLQEIQLIHTNLAVLAYLQVQKYEPSLLQTDDSKALTYGRTKDLWTPKFSIQMRLLFNHPGVDARAHSSMMWNVHKCQQKKILFVQIHVSTQNAQVVQHNLCS